jgi:hypothetical protein
MGIVIMVALTVKRFFCSIDDLNSRFESHVTHSSDVIQQIFLRIGELKRAQTDKSYLTSMKSERGVDKKFS